LPSKPQLDSRTISDLQGKIDQLETSNKKMSDEILAKQQDFENSAKRNHEMQLKWVSLIFKILKTS